MTDFIAISLPPMLIGLLASIACALLGNFLVLRRQSLIGDAISHVVLPGIVGAFLITGTVMASAMMLGAGVAALCSVGLIELIRRYGRVEPGAAMGVVFTAMFALGVLMLERFDLGGVHLDVEHALYGNLESLIWFSGQDLSSLIDPAALADFPPQAPRLAIVLAIVGLFIAAFWRELTIGTFDPDFADSIGARPFLTNFLLITLVAVTAVAAFDAVGSIIVIAMFICPPATARLLTDDLGRQVRLSILFATLSAILGYVLAGYGPLWLGGTSSVSAAGMIASVAGLFLAICCMLRSRNSATLISSKG